MNRNILILAICQAFGMSGAPLIVLVGGIIGSDLAPGASWSTLPIAMMIVGGALFSMPAAFLMAKIGRRYGFMLGSLLAVISSTLAIYAIMDRSFPLFCLATLGIGGNMAFIQQYRFAAAESVEKDHIGRAISFVLIGGIIAAFLGPELAKNSRDWLDFGPYSGSFAALAGIYGINIILMAFLSVKTTEDVTAQGLPRPLAEMILQPLFMTAVLGGLVAYSVMTFIMTATPISMHIIDGFSLDDTAWVVQCHVMAMYIPSLFSGMLIDRFGVDRIMISGVLLMTLCVLVALYDQHLLHYWSGLVLLGIGWNFLFVGGTTLLTKAYRPVERFRAQAVNDFTVYSFQAAASLSAGAIIYQAGWKTVNLVSLPLLFIMFIVILRVRRQTTADKD